MDKSWIKLNDFTSDEYVNGVRSFMRFSYKNMPHKDKWLCPCGRCLNQSLYPPNLVKLHLLTHGIDVTYSEWTHHGETSDIHAENHNSHGHMDETFEEEQLLEDLNLGRRNFDNYDPENTDVCYDDFNDTPDLIPDDEMDKFQKLLKDTQRKLYPGCSQSLLSFLVKLLNIKVLNRMTNKCYDMIISLFKEYLPDGDIIPPSFYEARKVLTGIGLGYELIHACKNDCILFWKEHESLENCPVCKESRWKVNDAKRKKIPHKILRYFPLKPRLQRLFMSKKTASDMRWHANRKIGSDDTMVHPSDSVAWKDFDKQYPWFGQDPRNIRLGFATDGFNPFGNMNNSYSIWPVILAVYNLPPWQCMKEPYLMLSLLIPGPRSPGKDIDVYLRPLIEELKELWVGVITRDAESGECFRLHAAILWTIHDLPAYSDISGHQTKGYCACPKCSMNTPSRRLRSKIGYLDNRRFLPRYHPYRKSLKFNGKIESGSKPRELNVDEILAQLKEVENVKLGKHSGNTKRKRSSQQSCWKKKSILFELPYWSKLKLRHNLDVMHIEKNICDNIIGTILDVDGKSKDTEKARLDLKDMGIRSELHLKTLDGAKANKDGKVRFLKPRAIYTLSQKDRQGFCQFLKAVKFPDGYAANISSRVSIKDGKITGLKSHDCHVLLQRLLPVGMRGFLNKDVLNAITELSSFFRQLCSRTLKLDVLDDLEKKIPVILCKLEMIFPPAFFDVMVHLSLHLANEAKLGGPVHYRWMYPIERSLGNYKGMVRNKARPEGSIAEAYIVKESLNFCSMYLHGTETIFNRVERNPDGEEHPNATLSVFKSKIRVFGETKYTQLKREDRSALHWFVLNNCPEIEIYLREHEEELKLENSIGWETRQKKEFALWFENRIKELRRIRSPEVSDELLALASGPHFQISRCSGCIVEGVKYLTRERDSRRLTQNSGVSTESIHKGKTIKFYGVLEDVIELSYVDNFRCVLFSCKWFDLQRHKPVKIDDDFTSINVSKLWYTSDPYVLANQVTQVFYVSDTKLGGDWKVVQISQHRHLFDPSLFKPNVRKELDMNDAYQQENCAYIQVEENNNEIGSVVRDDEAPLEVEISERVINPRTNNQIEGEEYEEEEDDTLGEEYGSSDEEASQAYVDSDLEYE
ncbi:hypothetical protein ACJIZ3_009345 [Penstemon smallii]|uniref:Transposase n=1 Tax=Penstemon smallii TaxID=265156 RepID=A0ABD3TC80_9LAMI